MPSARRLHHLELSPDSDLDESDSGVEVVHAALVSHERLLGALLGGLAGAVGGGAMLFVARELLARQGGSFDPATSLGEKLALHGGDIPPAAAGFGVAVAFGALIGALLGRSTWRVQRILPRTLFFSILAPTAWIFLQVFVIGHLSRAAIAAFPSGPFLLGALVYGLFLAIVPSLRRAQVRDVLPEKR